MNRVVLVVSSGMLLTLAAACEKPAEVGAPAEGARPVIVPVTESWIGAVLSERKELGDEIREYGTYVEVVDLIPAAPAEGKLAKHDVLVSIKGRTVTGAHQVISVISEHPVGQEIELLVRRQDKEVAVRLTTAARPTTQEMLRQLYLGKPLPPFSGTISTAKADGRGGFHSSCVMEDQKECPPYGRSGKTDLAVGQITALLLWTQYRLDTPLVFTVMRGWHERYGQSGLAIVAVTDDMPWTITSYLRAEPAHPPMTLVSVPFSWGRLRFLRRAVPAVVVLDEAGTVRAISLWTGEDFDPSGERMTKELLGLEVAE